MKEKLIEIGQDKINKAVTEFEGKAIDCLNFLTEQFISTFAEDVDIKLNGYKQDLDNLQNKYYQLEQENAELKAKLENAIVPKFNFGDTIFAVVTYIADPKDKTVIESGIVQKIECDKNQIKYWCDNGRIYWEDECEKLFATEQEAQQKLKELEERNEKVFI